MVRKLWTDFCMKVDGIVFFVDAADRDRLPTACQELWSLLRLPHLREVPFLILGNKIDKKEAVSESELREVLGLPFHQTYGKQGKNPYARPIEVFMCSINRKIGY